MTEWVHPALVLIAGAAVLPVLKGRARQIYVLALPAVALGLIASMPHGTFGRVPLLSFELVLGRVDALSMVFAWVFGIMLLINAVFALHVKSPLQHVAAFVYAGSALGVVFAGDLVTLYVFWELMVFSSVWLIWVRRHPASWAAGWRYVLVHAAGGVLLLTGLVMHYLDTGSLAFEAFTPDGAWFYLILIGFMINAAVPPLHAWLTDAYPEATVTGAVFLSVFTTKTAVYTLLRGYPGTELLVWFGAVMTLYGVVYAVLANNMRRLLSYHIVSQVGYMVAGVGMGTALALNGSASHAFTHILYKGLLFMGAGAIIHMTGRAKLTELGGLYRSMPVTFVMYMIAAFSISAVPLFSGFVSKTMVVEAAAVELRPAIWLMLSMAPAGTFLSVALKLPYFAFFGRDSGLRPQEAPLNMLVAMGIAAALCIFIGIYPHWLYSLMPTPVDYNPYTAGHVLWELQLLLFTGLGFFLLLKYARAEAKMTLDTDWLYRKAGPALVDTVGRTAVMSWQSALTGLQNVLRYAFDTVSRHHGPKGVLARTWPTGSMVLWVAVLLAASLIIYYF